MEAKNGENARLGVEIPTSPAAPPASLANGTTSGIMPSESAEASGPPSPQNGAPANFGTVEAGLYRSSFPRRSNVQFLEDLELRTIVTLVSTDFDPWMAEYMWKCGVTHYRIKVTPHKSEEDFIPLETIAQVMRLLMDPSKRPLLIHCNKGRHRTGCMIASFRHIKAYQAPESAASMKSIMAEYRLYASPKARQYDERFIKEFSAPAVLDSITSIKEPVEQSDLHVMLRTVNDIFMGPMTLADIPGPGPSRGPDPALLGIALEQLGPQLVNELVNGGLPAGREWAHYHPTESSDKAALGANTSEASESSARSADSTTAVMNGGNVGNEEDEGIGCPLFRCGRRGACVNGRLTPLKENGIW